MSELGRTLIFFGALLLVTGVVIVAAGRVPGIRWLGRLPGDFTWRRGGLVIYFPLGTSLVASVLLSLLLYLFRR